MERKRLRWREPSDSDGCDPSELWRIWPLRLWGQYPFPRCCTHHWNEEWSPLQATLIPCWFSVSAALRCWVFLGVTQPAKEREAKCQNSLSTVGRPNLWLLLFYIVDVAKRARLTSKVSRCEPSLQVEILHCSLAKLFWCLYWFRCKPTLYPSPNSARRQWQNILLLSKRH